MESFKDTYIQEEPVLEQPVVEKSVVEPPVDGPPNAEETKEKKPKKKKKKKEGDFFGMKNEPKKTLQTYLRNKSKLQINSFNIIDRKAAIMLRVNSAIISAIIIFYNKIEMIPFGMIIGIVLIVSCLFSLMFALNASRPHVFNTIFCFNKDAKIDRVKPEEHIFVAGSTAGLSLKEYMQAYDKVVRSQKLQIGNQIRAMHFFENYSRKAFIQIEISYLAFMFGFFSTVVLFVIGMFFPDSFLMWG